jgi:phosphoenolpyruvate carboxylase
MAANGSDRADAPLRRDVRLLGEILGRILVEQDGRELLDDEERIRLLARSARDSGESDRHEDVRSAVSALDLERQALLLRAFGVYFQLVNLAEQHHRLRRRRQYEHEERAPRESLAEAVARLVNAGVERADLERAAHGLSLELVLTAHPTEATRRTVLAAHLRLARLLGQLDDPSLTPARRRRVEAALAEEVTLLWQTDEIRSRRPHVVDEIRHGLWFFEQSLLRVSELVLADYRRLLPNAPAPFASGPGSEEIWTATRRPGPRRSPRPSTRPASWHWRPTRTRCASLPARSGSPARSQRRLPSSLRRSPRTSPRCRSTRRSSRTGTSTSRIGAS